MSEKTDREIMDEFFRDNAYAPGEGDNWRDVPVLDDDEEEAGDFDAEFEAFLGRIDAATSSCVKSGHAARSKVRRSNEKS